MEERQEGESVMKLGHMVLYMIQEEVSKSGQDLNQHDRNAIQLVHLICGFQLDLMKLITFLARLAMMTVRKEVEESQILPRTAKKKVEDIIMTYHKFKENQSDFSKLALLCSFDPRVNQPFVGNAPVQQLHGMIVEMINFIASPYSRNNIILLFVLIQKSNKILYANIISTLLRGLFTVTNNIRFIINMIIRINEIDVNFPERIVCTSYDPALWNVS
jgi:hypothetical protein